MTPTSSNVPDADTLRDELVQSFTAFEASFRKRFPLIWLVTLLMPLVLTAIILALVAFLQSWELAGTFVSHAFLTFFIFGRFIILLGTEGDEQILLNPGQLFAMVTYMDFVVATFVTFHMGFLFRAPWIGPKISMLVWDGKFIMDSHPWLRRMAFFGLVTFVIFPTSTTGSIGGSIFGRLLGMSRVSTVLGVLLGSLAGNGLMYIFSKQINQYIGHDNYWLKILGAAILVLLAVLAEMRYRRVKQKYVDRVIAAGKGGLVSGGGEGSTTDAVTEILRNAELPPVRSENPDAVKVSEDKT